MLYERRINLTSLFLFYMKRDLKSFKTLIVSAVYFFITYLFIRYGDSVGKIFDNSDGFAILKVMYAVFAFVGFLFGASLFSNIISQGISSRDFRFILPYKSRRVLYFSKFLMSFVFFLLQILIATIVVLVFREDAVFSSQQFCNISIFYFYMLSIITFISTISKNDRTAMLVNIIISIIYPAIFLFSNFVNHDFLELLLWITPYHYIEKTWEVLFLMLLSVVFLGIGASVFEKKEI